MQPQPPGHAYPQTTSHLAPAHDTHHHRASHLGATLTPATAPRIPQQQMVPTPGPAAMANNQYNRPPPVEVYVLGDSMDAAVPADVKAQFQCDDAGRLLFFNAPPLHRPHPPVTPQQAGLGHSVSHLANIHKVREERRRKRQERDEAAEREAGSATKKLGSIKDMAGSKPYVVDNVDLDPIVKWIHDFSDYMLAGNAIVEQRMEGWRDTKAAIAQERAKLSPAERRTQDLRFLFDAMVKDGVIKADERALYEEVYVQRRYLKEVDERDNSDFLLGNRGVWEKRYGHLARGATN
jgi:chromatin structure-remodeling complex subunit RSC1/2